MKATDRALEQMAARNLWGNVNMHIEGRCPKELRQAVRFRCLASGGNPGITQDIKLAMIEHGWENPSLQKSWFHPDYLARTAGQWSSNWRHSSLRFIYRTLFDFLEANNSRAVDCSCSNQNNPQ